MLGLLQSKAMCCLWNHDLASQFLNLSYCHVLCVVLPLVTRCSNHFGYVVGAVQQQVMNELSAVQILSKHTEERQASKHVIQRYNPPAGPGDFLFHLM